MAVRIVGLKQALAPTTEPVAERNYHAVVVGHCVRGELSYPAESRVGAWRNRRAGAQPGGERAEAPCICGGVLH